MSLKFRVGISTEFLDSQGRMAFGDIGLSLLDSDPLIEYEFWTPNDPEATPDQIRDFDGVIALRERYTRRTLADNNRLAVIARFGVGYDKVDTEACTDSNVMLVITPDGVRRPVATSILALILALSLRLPEKDRYTRAGRAKEAGRLVGTGLRGKVLGSIGIGNIGRELFRLAAPLDMVHVAHDPFVEPAEAAQLGVRLVGLPTLLRESDFICVNCPLSSKTRGLVGPRELALCKPTAFLVNTARGPIVDIDALIAALQGGRLAGAGLDVTDPEMLPLGHPLASMENVIVTSHSLCWTDELMLGNGSSAIEALRAVARGQVPQHVVNAAVLQREGLASKLSSFRQLAASSTQ